MAITFYDFKQLHNETLRNKAKERIAEIIDCNAFIDGTYNKSFESRFAAVQGAKHCRLVANGTDAIEIALKAYGIGPGDKVGIPGISFYSTAEAVINVGAEPYFIDVDPATGLIDPTDLQEALNNHVQLKAIIPVHIYGLPAPIETLETICESRKISIIEDAAQAQGTYLMNGPVGSSNNLTTFSFYPTKNLGAFGDAGAVLSQNDELIKKVIQVGNHGRSPEGHTLVGRNSRCDSFQAAILDLKLDEVNELNKKRKIIARKMHNAFADLGLRLVPEELIDRSSWHLYPIGLESKEKKYELKEFLAKKEIASALFYEKSMAEEKPLYQFGGNKEKGIDFAAKTICLPMHPFITDEDISTMRDALKEFLGK